MQPRVSQELQHLTTETCRATPDPSSTSME